MHRTIELIVPPQVTDGIVTELSHLEEVIGISVHRGASVKPVGDQLTVHVLNRGADKVLQRVAKAQEKGAISVTTAELTSIIDSSHREAVDKDVDEAIWEEMETGLRHQGRITPNYIALMALGGAIAAIGLLSDPVHQAIAFVAAPIIAPGFEPLAKIPLGVVLRQWDVVQRGVVSSLVGYLVLMAAAALTFVLLRALGAASVEEFITNPELEFLSHPTAKEILFSAGGAAAGAIMIAAYRRSVIAGPLITLVIVHAAAMVGMALTCGRFDLAWEGVERVGLDVLLIVGLGALLFTLKQGFVHRRKPLV